VHGDKQLFNPAYPEKMRKAAEASLRKRGVDLFLGEHLDPFWKGYQVCRPCCMSISVGLVSTLKRFRPF
jgi:hypothetical protein